MTNDTEKKTRHPASAFTCSAGELKVEMAGDPLANNVSLMARSSQPIDHWYWGRVVHDLSGARLSKPRIPIDYAHNADEVIGYLDTFEVEDEGLRTNGQLVVFRDDDRAAEVSYKAAQGVPFEASINFGGDGIQLEEIAEGDKTDVNGFEFSGPGVVVRSWPLRGVAICPYGADSNTETSVFNSNGAEFAVEYLENGRSQLMATAKKKKDDQPEKLATVTEEEKEIVENETDEVAQAPPAVEEAKAPANLRPKFDQEEGQRFVDAFGDQGAVWFVDGLSFSEASEKFISGLIAHNEELIKENAELRQRIDSVEMGEAEPLEFSVAGENELNPHQELRRDYAKSMPPAAAAFAASFEARSQDKN